LLSEDLFMDRSPKKSHKEEKNLVAIKKEEGYNKKY
jgi:hypothetical protein